MSTLSQIIQPNNVTTSTNTQELRNKTIRYADNNLEGVQAFITLTLLPQEMVPIMVLDFVVVVTWLNRKCHGYL